MAEEAVDLAGGWRTGGDAGGVAGGEDGVRGEGEGMEGLVGGVPWCQAPVQVPSAATRTTRRSNSPWLAAPGSATRASAAT